MSIFKEFKEFAMRGNVIDLAVGVVIGGAFGKIVSSLVGDLLMPPLGLLLGGVSFTGFKISLREATANAPAVTLNYGNFLQACFDFIIISFAIFCFVKLMNSLHATHEKNKPAPAPSREEVLLSEIRDILKDQKSNQQSKDSGH